MKNILIIGAGWLGFPLAQTLTTLGHTVFITRRSQEALESLDFPPAENGRWISIILMHTNSSATISIQENLTWSLAVFLPAFARAKALSMPSTGN